MNITQRQNFREYGHSKSYCVYNSRYVRCGQNYASSECEKHKDTPAKCAL